jgi:hypothetical protein
LGGADTAFETAIESAKSGIGAGEGRSRLDEDLPRAVVVIEAIGTEDPAAGDVIVGRQTRPGAEVLGGGKGGEIGADFGDEGLGAAGAEAG